jgi:signal peptidase I
MKKLFLLLALMACNKQIENRNSRMLPSIQVGAMLKVTEVSPEELSLKRGDVILYNWKGYQKLGRVIGIAGDRVQHIGHVILLNGSALPQTTVPGSAEIIAGLGSQDLTMDHEVYEEKLADRQYRIVQRKIDPVYWSESELTVPRESVWVLEDNRDLALDSRRIGFIKFADVKGIVQP